MAQVKLGDVALESRETYKGDKSGMPIVGLEHITPGEVTLSNWDTDTDNTFTKRFRKGDMLFGRRRAYLKKAAQAPFDGICSGDITVIRAKEALLLPELLPFIIQNDNLFDFAVGKSAGSLSPRVKWDNLKNYTFELPPMEEQRKLAEVLWSINDTLLAYQKLLTETDALVQAQFIEMFGDPADNSSHLVKMTVHEAVKRGYIERPLDGNHGEKHPKGSDYVPDGVPFIMAKDLIDKHVDFEGCNHIAEEQAKTLTKGWAKTGDVLLTHKGTIGRVAVVQPSKYEHILLTPQVTYYRCLNKIDKEFLAAYFCTNYFMDQMKKLVTGTTRACVTITQQQQLQLIIPSLDLQQKFVEFVDQNDKSKSALQNTITSLQATKRCILENTLGTRRKE